MWATNGRRSPFSRSRSPSPRCPGFSGPCPPAQQHGGDPAFPRGTRPGARTLREVAERIHRGGRSRGSGQDPQQSRRLYLRRGDLESSRRSFEESLTFLERSGNRYDRATVRGSLAVVLTESDDTAAALPLYQETLEEFRALGDRKSQADTLIGPGRGPPESRGCRESRTALGGSPGPRPSDRRGSPGDTGTAPHRTGPFRGRSTEFGEGVSDGRPVPRRAHARRRREKQNESALAEMRQVVGDTTARRTLPRHTCEPGGNPMRNQRL